MSIFRVEKIKNYTVMSNYHLDDSRLSLKSVGLLSKILRLPDDWDFSIKGLAKVCHDGADSIESALRELEKYHYIKRERQRDEKGHLGKMLYTVYEIPYDTDRAAWVSPCFVSCGMEDNSPDRGFPDQGLPDQGLPDQGLPDQGLPDRENPPQINTNINQITNQLNTKKTSTNINQSSSSEIVEKRQREERLMDLRKKINYERFVADNQALETKLEEDTITVEEFSAHYTNLQVLDMILESVLDTVDATEPPRIGRKRIPAGELLERFLRLSYRELADIIRLIVDKQPKNRRVYALTVIYNH